MAETGYGGRKSGIRHTRPESKPCYKHTKFLFVYWNPNIGGFICHSQFLYTHLTNEHIQFKKNKMKKGILGLITWALPFILLAQNETSHGINWTEGLTWEQVKQKAKQENKYIFVDAYATWCGPCKLMDKYVYPNDTIGDFFNEHFIAVKAQMDLTDSDSKSIKDWYDDATAIKTEYAVEAYPSLIFLSPDGKILQKEEGYRPVPNLLAVAKQTLSPGKVYDDPYKEYKALVTEYRLGIKHYDKMPYMIKTALKLQESDFAKKLLKEHLDYAKGLSYTERYKKENIELWASFNLSLTSVAFQFFYKDGYKIDQVMNQKGYSFSIVDRSIQARIVDSFFKMQKGITTIITGKQVPNSEIMFMRLPSRTDGKIEPDYVEANWKSIKIVIGKRFNKDYAKRNVLTARIRWYQQHQNMLGASEMIFTKLDKYPPESLKAETISINHFAWQTFLYVNDKKLLKKAAKWMKKLVQHNPTQDVVYDTYASLLYKMGRTKEAIQWEEKAINTTNPVDEEQKANYNKIIAQMTKREPTYLEQGAIWLTDN
jgi:thioredoxin-related protein